MQTQEPLPFVDRVAGGRALATALREHFEADGERPDLAEAIVLALPRGGVPVAHEVARDLRLPLDVFVVRKLGVPAHRELAMGAIASGGVRVLNDEVVHALGISAPAIEEVARSELMELERREDAYRAGHPPLSVAGRTIILVDDGLATGSTMRAAVEALRRLGAGPIIVAVPVAPPDACDEMRGVADDVVCAATPEPFRAVGLWYEEFSETTDDEVRRLLARAHPSGTIAPGFPTGDAASR